MVTGRWRIHFSNRAFRAGLIPVCGVAAWLQGSQAVAVPAPPAAGRPPHQASADAPAGGPPETFHPGVPLAGSAIGPTGPTGFATAYATSYSCAFEFQPCDLAEFSGVSCATASSCSAVGTSSRNHLAGRGLGRQTMDHRADPAAQRFDLEQSRQRFVHRVDRLPGGRLLLRQRRKTSARRVLGRIELDDSTTARPTGSVQQRAHLCPMRFL